MASVALERAAGRLPAEVTRFVGRKRELTDARRLLETSRLVTLTGVSGVGKTRLALRVATGVRRTFGDGVWFVELSALRDAELMAQTVAEALGLPDQSSRDRLDVLADHLSDKHLLLVLDTCEHLVDACAMLAEVLLRAAPRLHILATSREPLDVMGEHTMVIPPLAVPEADSAAAGLAEFDAVALFADRAAAIVPGFSLADQDPAVVAGLCRRLDGLPLAIELAAVRLRALSVEQILERLDDRFRLLGSTRTSRNRHQTLRAAVAWSHELCTPAERLLWARLTVFPAGFDLTAAERICADDELPADEVFDTLARLVEKSIVLREEDGRRYRMLDTLREFGADRLAQAGGADTLSRRHRDWFAGLAIASEAEVLTARQLEWAVRLRRELPNLRDALEFSLAEEAPQAMRMAAALTHFWFSAGFLTEGRRWLARALDADADADAGQADDRAKALCAAGLLAALQSDLETAEACRREATGLAEAADEITFVAQLEGVVAFFGNDFDRARELLAGPAGGMGGRQTVWTVLRLPLLAALHCLIGELDKALEYCEQCRRISEACGERWCLAYALWVRSLARILGGDLATATVDAHASLKLMRELDDQLGGVMAIDLMAGCAGFAADLQHSARLFGAADHLWRTLGAPLFFGPGYLRLRDVVVGEVRVGIGEREWGLAQDEGGRMTLAEATAFALGESLDRPAGGPAGWEPLTRREREIAKLVAEGMSNRDIAQQLVIAKRTVDSHIEHIYAKLGLASRTQLATWVSERR